MSELTITGKITRGTAGRRPPKPVPSTTEPVLPRTEPKPPGPSRLARMLALAYHVEHLIDAGQLEDYAHAARVLGITRARISQIVSLIDLQIDFQETILTGDCIKSERDLRSRRRVRRG